MIVMEDLKICNMSKSAGGTIEEPGRHVAHKNGEVGIRQKRTVCRKRRFDVLNVFLKAMPIGWPHKIFSVEAWDC